LAGLIRLLEGIINLLRGISLFFRLSSVWQVLFYLFLFILVAVGIFFAVKKLVFKYFEKNWYKHHIKNLNLGDLEKHLSENPNRVLIEYMLTLSSAFRQDFHNEINKEIVASSEKYLNYEKVVLGTKDSILKLKNELENANKVASSNQSSMQSLVSQYSQLLNTLELQNTQLKDYQSGFFATHTKVIIENLLSVIDVIGTFKSLNSADKDALTELIEINVLRPLHVHPLEVKVGDAFDYQFMKALPVELAPPSMEKDEEVYEIVQKGYRVIEGDVSKLLKPCLVKIYKNVSKPHTNQGGNV